MNTEWRVELTGSLQCCWMSGYKVIKGDRVIVFLINSPAVIYRPPLQDNLSFETTQGVNVVRNFEEMGLREELMRGLYAYGFEKPSAIQQRAIVPIIEGRDVIAQAQSGTGKTSLIALTMCQLLDTSLRE